jgi:hypothetical protein
MSRLRKGAVPTRRHHKAHGCAGVTIDGHDHYLGPFGTPSSKRKYADLIRVWQQRQEQPNPESDAPLVSGAFEELWQGEAPKAARTQHRTTPG